MELKYKACKYPGISYREHAKRKHGKQKDRYYRIRYTLSQKTVTEALGWASEGWTEQKANEILCELKANIRLGKHPQTLAEMRKMNEQQTNISESSNDDQHFVTLNEVFLQYIERVKKDESHKSYLRKNGLFYNWIINNLKNKALQDIKASDIEQLKDDMLAKGQSVRSVQYVLSTISLIFKYAETQELYQGINPVTKVKIKSKDNRRTRFFTKDEAKLLLNELKKHSEQVHDMALLALYCGLRANEIFKLQWKNVIWNTSRLSIKDPKNGESRMQPIHPIVREMLVRRYKEGDVGYIFKSQKGEKIKEVSNTFSRIVDKLKFNDGITDKLDKLVFHSLRHTYASWLVMNGVDLYTTQKLMGHNDISMTQRYAHLAPGHLEQAVNKLEVIGH